MDNYKFQKFVVYEEPKGSFVPKIEEDSTDNLPDGDVLIKVHYSSLNYKDALSASGHKGITRNYPHTPGIDAAGIVVKSLSPEIQAGEEIIVTGYDLGMNTSGGFGGFIRVPAEWVVPLPKGLTLEESMILGTAGFTVGLCLYEFQRRDLIPPVGPILVTGASGGVGSIAVSILSNIGYEVTASTGKSEQSEFLKMLGASLVIPRITPTDNPDKPLLPKKWKGVIDNVGGDTLSYCIKTTDFWGTIAVVGLVSSDKLNTTLYPFLLRGVSMVGIDSADRPYELRKSIWNKLANEWKPDNLDKISRQIALNDLSAELNKIIEGKQVGRIILKHDD